ncbi:MAG: hypothetical protein ACREMY_01895 [bacterium]
MLGGRSARRQGETLHLLLLDALADHYGGDLPGVDHEIGSDATDEEFAQALTAAGALLLVSIIRMPPVQGKDHAEKRLLNGALAAHPQQGVVGSQFLAHALVEHVIADAELSSRFADRLDYPTAPPRAIEERAREALRAHTPIGQHEADALRLAKAHMFEGIDSLLADPERDAQGAIGWRTTDYELTAAVHAIRMLLGKEYERSQTARDNSGYSNLSATMKIGHIWAPAEKSTFEAMRTVGGDPR